MKAIWIHDFLLEVEYHNTLHQAQWNKQITKVNNSLYFQFDDFIYQLKSTWCRSFIILGIQASYLNIEAKLAVVRYHGFRVEAS